MRWLVYNTNVYSVCYVHTRYDHGENHRAIIDKEKLALLQLAAGFFSCTSALLIDRYIVANDLSRCSYASTILSLIIHIIIPTNSRYESKKRSDNLRTIDRD